jgi:acyl-coenzyme A synthetase/AMP-(fatty) acid ligase/SAM-dependent methyltransferase
MVRKVGLNSPARCCAPIDENMEQSPTSDEAPPWLTLFACPACRGPLEARGAGTQAACARCKLLIPVVAGFPLFPERDLDDGTDPAAALAAVEARAFSPAAAFEGFLAERRRRGLVDAYAAFQPFNESARTLFSFVPLVRPALRPGDVVLDLSNRSGFTGELLAGLFPEQRVVSLWEGNRDTLGYQGYRYWLPPGRRAPNLTIAFADPNEPLPFADGAVALVHAYDSLHRFRQEVLLPELLRVTRRDGALLFTHVHLSNGRPEPFFERPGRLRHGATYCRVWDRLLAGQDRRAFVLGERGLFESQRADPPARLTDAPETPNYNAMVAVMPSSAAGAALGGEPELPSPLGPASVVVSPLVVVSLADGAVTLREERGEGTLGDLYERHPVYRERLEASLPGRLDARARGVLYWAERLPTVAAVAARLGEEPAALAPVLALLAAQELVRVHALSRAAYRLQRWHSGQDQGPLADEDELAGVFRRAVEEHGDRPFLLDDTDGSSMTYREADAVIAAAMHRLRASGIGRGARVALCAPLHLEAILLFWAVARVGGALAILDHDAPPDLQRALLDRLSPALVVTDAARHAALALVPALRGPVVLLDDAAGGAEGVPSFSEWLTEEDLAAGPAEPASGVADEPAAILFTSGTTGVPKGVVLSQRALAHGGRLLARHFGLRSEDVHLGLGDLHVMSGLRNPAIAVVHAGACTVIASAEVRTEAVTQTECVARRRVTVLSTLPAALRRLTLVADRLPPRALAPVRLVLTAGAALPSEVRDRFQALFDVRVRDYYGLTETAGLCIAEPLEDAGPRERSLGVPVDALLRVVDDEGADVPRGAEGELWVHGQNLMVGYLDDPAATRAAFAGPWFRTGDRVRLTADGRCVLLGRTRDIIKNAHAEIVSAREVEEAILALPGVADAGATPYVDAAGQDQLAAAVVPAVSFGDGDARAAWLAELRRLLFARLGQKRMPARLLACSALPRNAAGKVRRETLLELLDHAD